MFTLLPRHFFSLLILLSLAPVGASSLRADSPESPPLNYRFGVATHFCHKTPWMKTWDAEKYIPMIADLGVGWIRDEITWQDTELQRGQYRVSDNTRKWIGLARAHGLKVIVCFNNTNPNYPDRWDPDAYAKAAAWLAVELDGKIDAIEILNEPFGGYAVANNDGRPHDWTGRDSDGSASPWLARYLKLLNTSADAIKAANPRMTVIGLGSCTPQNYRLLDMGVSRNVDAITDHPYSFRSPPELVPHPDNETYSKRVGFSVADADGTFASYVRMCLDYSKQHHGPGQLWITESGYTTYREGRAGKEPLYSGFSEQAQASYIPRRLLEGLALGLPVDIVYDFLDDSGRAGVGKPGDPFDPEQNFGIVREGGIPKPAYFAVQNLARATVGFTPGNDISFKVFPFSDRTENKPRDWDGMKILPALARIMAYPFTDAQGRPVLAVWSAERINDLSVRSADIEFAVDPDRFTVTVLDLLTGVSFSPAVKTSGGRIMLEHFAVPGHPVLITLHPASHPSS
ncbi:MAG: hypothetical protein WC205_03040 [Opitutaceae bacterium]|jgi:hypothetical protein